MLAGLVSVFGEFGFVWFSSYQLSAISFQPAVVSHGEVGAKTGCVGRFPGKTTSGVPWFVEWADRRWKEGEVVRYLYFSVSSPLPPSPSSDFL